MIEMLTATGSVLLTWALLGAVFIGVGLIVQRLFGLKIVDTEHCLIGFWMGFCFVIIFLQVWHFWFAVTWHALATVVAAGTAGLVWHAADLFRWLRTTILKRRAACLVLFVAAAWIAEWAIGPDRIYESASYYLSMVRWATTYPLVPGLGNLHGRLAFNNSNLLYAAMLEVGPWYGRSNHLANGLLILMLLVQLLVSTFLLFGRSKDYHVGFVFDATLLAPTIDMVLREQAASLTADVPPAVMLFVAASRCFAFLTTTHCNDEKRRDYHMVVIATLLAVSFCMKASAAAFAASAWWLIFLIWLFKAGRTRGKSALKMAAVISSVTLTAIIPWLVRGIIFSGYPFYPSTIISFPVEWRVPAEQAEAEKAWIGQFARYYYNPDAANLITTPTELPSTWAWLKPWLSDLVRKRVTMAILPTALTAMVWCIYLFYLWVGRSNPIGQGWLLLLPTVAALAFWFFTAPNPRLGFFLFWTLAAASVAVVFQACLRLASIELQVTFLTGLLCMAIIPIARSVVLRLHDGEKTLLMAIVGSLVFRPGTDRGFNPNPIPELETFVTRSGLILYVPKDLSNFCWDAPLPCTPHPAPNLRLRRDGNLRSGFVTDGSWQAARWPNPQSSFLSFWRQTRAEREQQ